MTLNMTLSDWTRRGAAVLLASVIACGTLLSFGATAHGEAAANDKQGVGKAAAQSSAGTAAAPDRARTSTEARQEWKQWMKDNAIGLDSIQPEAATHALIPAERFADLDGLKPLLQDKRIVYLGESSHGAAEYNSAKTRMIQYLHQELGFNVVAFETNLGNAASAYGHIRAREPVATMKDSIFGIWQAQETVPLFQYIKDTHNTKTPLALAGFDMQPQGPLFTDEWMGDAKLAKQFQDAEQELDEWELTEDVEGYRKAKPKLLKVYQQVRALLPKRAEELQRQYPDNPHIVKLMERALDNRIQVVEEYMEISINSTAFLNGKSMDYMSIIQSSEYRDRMMADNRSWLATHVYPNEKIIVWAHNGHIAKAYSQEMNSLPRVHMGELMQKTEFKDQSYVIGLYMGGGRNAHVTGGSSDVLPPMPHSIEEVMKGAEHSFSFVDMRYAKRVPGNSWMTQPNISYYDGVMPVSSIPAEQFDGILFID
ncbi:erythromycin esterase family protein [Paenibacillus thiaminolyticus]|uniref:erythromycin esterase family protein n=1 Tax=Paenibacillus thiaminolyticus TaxID=49283 RepID=UPI002175CC8D|nr:erythromycin esterase family protein [Paenibacillus thiaminolyticus]